MTRTHRIAVDPRRRHRHGGRPGGPARSSTPPPRLSASNSTSSTFDFASADYYLEHGTMLPDRLVRHPPRVRRDLLRRRRLARGRARPHLAVGQPAAVPPRASTSTSTCGRSTAARRDQPTGRPRPRRRRLLRRAGEHRRRILQRRRQDLRRHRPRNRHAGNGHDPHRCRPNPQIRVRPRAVPAQEAPHLGDQEQRHLHHHALLGRTGAGDGRQLPRRRGGQVPHRHPDGELRASTPTGSTSSSPQTCSATSSPTSAPPAPAPSASPPAPTSTRNATSPACSNPCTAPRPTSPAKASPTPSARSGAPR